MNSERNVVMYVTKGKVSHQLCIKVGALPYMSRFLITLDTIIKVSKEAKIITQKVITVAWPANKDIKTA